MRSTRSSTATLGSIVALAIGCGGCAPRFVRAEGSELKVGRRAFYFVGANVDLLHGAANRARQGEILDAAKRDGLSVVRVWALGEGPADASAGLRKDYLFRAGPDGWSEDAFVALDGALALARARGLYVILTLCNYWGDYGGVPEYLRWAGLPTDGWAARDRFYADTKTRALYRAHLDRLLTRTNRRTGVRYVDDPTIFAWELMNESRVDSDAGAAARIDFIDEMSRYLRARDPHHLVSPGLIGYATRRERDAWLRVCRLAAVDYCDSHLYPQSSDRVESGERLDAFIDDRVQLARHVAKKPIVFGEFGFRTDAAAWLGAPRADWFARFLGRAFLDGAAGALAWIYQPWDGTPRDFGIYIDRADTADVRASLRRAAARARAATPRPRNAALSDDRGAAPLYDPYEVAHRAAKVRLEQRGARLVVDLSPSDFSTGKWERVGSWDTPRGVHAYGVGDGYFEWRFSLPRAARLRSVAARISSEFPGETAPPDGTSEVAVSIDGRALGAVTAPPDDGRGLVRAVGADAPLAAGEHALRFSVAGVRANGLCVYDDRAEPSPVRLELE